MINCLENIRLNEIYDAFIDAFSNYETKMDLTIDQLRAMLFTRSYTPKYSIGYFEDGTLAGFLLIGYREILGQKVFYDTATGIRQKYQRKGIGNALLAEVKREMEREGIDRFVLEVLENNIAAQDLYKKQGFQITRRLCCYEFDVNDINGPAKFKGVRNSCIENEFLEYCSFSPTWQNSNESFNNCKNDYSKIDFYNDKEKIGYVIINEDNGSTLQLGMRKRYRNGKDIESLLLCLKNDYGVEKIRLLNIEGKCEMDILLKEFGMRNFINQYEMEFNTRSTYHLFQSESAADTACGDTWHKP